MSPIAIGECGGEYVMRYGLSFTSYGDIPRFHCCYSLPQGHSGRGENSLTLVQKLLACMIL